MRRAPNEPNAAWSRRSVLGAGLGLGLVALSDLLAREGAADDAVRPRPDLNGGLHHPAKVRRVIQLFMNGGASQIDTFDYKPALERLHGQKLGPSARPEGFTGDPGALMKCPFPFRRHGETGRWVSSVFPEVAGCVDDLAFLMALTSKTNVHGPASALMNTGFLLPGFPCLGAWVSYGLGRLTDDLPTFVVLPDGRGLPYNNQGNFTSGFLPAVHQGVVLDASASPPIPHLAAPRRHGFVNPGSDRDGLALLDRLNRDHASAHPGDSRLDARIAAYELAARLQLSAPEAFDLAAESPATRRSYGLDEPVTADFGRRCLLARRLVERGVRFVQVWSGTGGATDNWDNHADILRELPAAANSVDRPIAGLLRDLKARGLWDDTLIVWSTEFGRTPFAQGSTGRDHNGGTSAAWLAGAGIRAGASHGRSDDWSWQAAEGKTDPHDLHATILHLLGVDHTRLTFRHNGIDRRLTDVHGHVVREILA